MLPKSLQPATPAAGSKAAKAAAKKGAKKSATKISAASLQPKLEGLLRRKPSSALIKSLKERLPDDADKFDLTQIYSLDKEMKTGGTIANLKIPKGGARAAVLLTAPEKANDFVTFTVVQMDDGQVVGGNTYVVRAAKK